RAEEPGRLRSTPTDRGTAAQSAGRRPTCFVGGAPSRVCPPPYRERSALRPLYRFTSRTGAFARGGRGENGDREWCGDDGEPARGPGARGGGAGARLGAGPAWAVPRRGTAGGARGGALRPRPGAGRVPDRRCGAALPG